MDYRPLGNNYPVSQLSLSFGFLALATVSLPLTAFVICVIWSVMFNFDASTSTHCGVKNYLPSISAAIGAFSPQKYIWRLAVALHSTPRYAIALMYYKLKHNSKLLLVLNCLEISCLVGLTFVSSTENYPIHEKCFITFMASALAHMFLVNYWFSLKTSRLHSKIKVYLAWTNLAGGTLAVYFFIRHNWYCESGVYTLFALSEYVVVVSNILFHFQAYYDFRDIDFCTIGNLKSSSVSFA